MMRYPGVLVATVLVLLAVARPAAATQAAPPLTIVHSERVALGSATLTASFTDWPVRAGRSLDLTFELAGGIDGHSGTLRAVAPSGAPTPLGISGSVSGDVDMTLQRHPLARHAWGLDVVALPEEGPWRFEFTVRSPRGTTTTGTLAVTAGPVPGPPMALSWVVGMLPWMVAVLFLAYRWVRTRPRRPPLTWSG